MHTDDTVSAHDTSIIDKYSAVFVRFTDNNQQFDVFIVLSVAYVVDTDCNSAVVQSAGQ